MTADQPDPNAPDDEVPASIKAREAHYEKHFGPIDQPVLQSKEKRAPYVDVYQFAPTEGRPYWTLITSGMSDQLQPGLVEVEGMNRRAEILLYVHEPQQWMFDHLKRLAETPFRGNSFLHWHHTVPSGQPMTARDSQLTSAFFLPPYFESEDFDTLSIDLERVDILWMVPITEAERRFAMKSGGQALEDLMAENELDPVVFEDRESLV